MRACVRAPLASASVRQCMRFEIEGEEGQVLAAGRDLNQLKALLAPKLKAGMLTSPNRYNRDGIKHWDFGDLPERVEVDRGLAWIADRLAIA